MDFIRRFMKIKPGEKCRDKKNNYEKRTFFHKVPGLKQYRLPLSLRGVLSRSNLISAIAGLLRFARNDKKRTSGLAWAHQASQLNTGSASYLLHLYDLRLPYIRISNCSITQKRIWNISTYFVLGHLLLKGSRSAFKECLKGNIFY